MDGKVRSVDFSKHDYRTKIFVNGNEEIRVDELQLGDSYNRYVKFINTDTTLTVTGDYGNWVFCRPFHPSKDGGVSSGYWIEKLETHSVQDAMVFDGEATYKELEEMINGGLEDYGYEGDRLWEIKTFYQVLQANTDDLFSYEWVAYRNNDLGLDYDEIPLLKNPHRWLIAVFDAFEEMRKRS